MRRNSATSNVAKISLFINLITGPRRLVAREKGSTAIVDRPHGSQPLFPLLVAMWNGSLLSLVVSAFIMQLTKGRPGSLVVSPNLITLLLFSVETIPFSPI